MKLADVVVFVCSKRLAVISTVNPEGGPEAALIGYAFDPGFGLVFDTAALSRKARNLRGRAEAAIVIGWDEETTVQLEGVGCEPAGHELSRAKEVYFDTWPDGRAREAWRDITCFLNEPSWMRYSRYTDPPEIVEVFGPFA
jgi:pyridoxine/pyridoxamine 5'-phosphate oxidase